MPVRSAARTNPAPTLPGLNRAVLRSAPAMAAPPTAEQIREVNTRYHDVAAAEYDAKWGIDFGEIGQGQVLGKARKLLGSAPGPFGDSLEIGSGTRYFSLNLPQAGGVEGGTCPDNLPRVPGTLAAHAQRPGLDGRPGGA